MMIKMARHCFRVSYLIVGALLIVLAICSIAARIGLPLVAGHKDVIESRVSEYLQSPVEIGDLSLRWQGAGPMLHATDVVVLETPERSVKLDQLLIDINLVKSLLRGTPSINELSLMGARLAFETDATGQIRLHGMDSIEASPAAEDNDLSPNRSSGIDVVAWLFNAGKVSLLNTELILMDLTTDSQIVVDDLNIRAQNNGQDHKLRVEARLPVALGGDFEAGIDLVGDADALSESSGNWYVSAESFNMSGLRTLLELGGFLNSDASAEADIDASGSVEMWGHWYDGQLVSARGPLNFGNVVDGSTGETLLDNVSAQLQLIHDNNATSIVAVEVEANRGADVLQLDELRIDWSTPGTAPDESPDKTLDKTPETPGTPDSKNETIEPALFAAFGSDPLWLLSASGAEVGLDLSGHLAAIALASSRPELAEEFRHASISGTVHNFAFDMSGAPDKPLINLRGDVSALSIGDTTTIPAFGPLTGSVSIKDSAGSVQLASKQMPLSWSALSDELLQVDRLEAAVDVDLRDLQRVQVGAEIQLADNGITTSTSFNSTLVPGGLPHLQVQSNFEAEDVSRIASWLPRKKLSPALTTWIEQALVAGKATDGSLLFHGNPADFPFEEGEGVFNASVKINQGELDFLPQWPTANNISGELELNGMTLTGNVDGGALDRFTASDTRFAIDNLLLPVLQFSTTAQGKLQDLADFAVTGPLKDLLKPVLEGISGTGETQMDLALSASLFEEPAANDDAQRVQAWKPLDVAGSVFLHDNDVSFSVADLVLEDAVGAVGFSENGVVINNLGGNLLSHEVKVSADTQGQGDAATTTIKIKGALEANDLLAHYGNPLDQFIRGTSYWDVVIAAPHSQQRIADEGVTLTLSSDLTGTRLLLPAPYSKGASTAERFTLSTAFGDDTGSQLWDVQYGDELRTRVRLVDDEFHSMLIEPGQNYLADELARDIPPGVRLQGNVQSLAADGWIEVIAQYINSIPATEGDVEPILPISVELNTEQLVLGRELFGKTTLQANSDDTYLNFAVANKSLSGNVQYPRAYWDKSEVLTARIESLDWSVIDALAEASDDTGDGSSSSNALDPRLLPRVEAKVSLLTRNNLRLRDLALRTEPNVSGLDVTTLGFAYDTMRLVGQGHWYLRDPQGVSAELVGKHSSQLNLVLQSDDFGVGFEELGLSGVVADAQGTIEMKVNWPGPLYAPEIARLDGTAKVDIEAGSILPFEPGAGRVVGLFALQALPRRLNLDFKDLTHDGVAFKSITGTAAIDNGIADVPLLQLTGPIGVVDIVGTSDLNTQEFDQTVTVLPRISAALPVIGAITGGATAGVGVLLAAGLLKALGVDFDRIGLRTYSLTGPWDKPIVAPIETDYSW